MSKSRTGDLFVKAFVIGLGFLSGVWIHLDFDPVGEILGMLSELSPGLSIFSAIPTLIVVAGLVIAFMIGKWTGIIAIGLAFIAGLLFSPFSLILLIIAILLGTVAPKK